MGLLRVTLQVRVVEFPTTTLMRVAVTCTSGGTALEQVTQHNVTSDHGDPTRDLFTVYDGVKHQSSFTSHLHIDGSIAGVVSSSV